MFQTLDDAIKLADSPKPTYYSTSQEAKEAIIKDAYEYIEVGYRVYTGDGIIE
jgi:hypothetical protein